MTCERCGDQAFEGWKDESGRWLCSGCWVTTLKEHIAVNETRAQQTNGEIRTCSECQQPKATGEENHNGEWFCSECWKPYLDGVLDIFEGGLQMVEGDITPVDIQSSGDEGSHQDEGGERVEEKAKDNTFSRCEVRCSAW